MKRYKLSLSYDGTNYSGWQRQPNGVAIQQIIEEKLHLILRVPIKITGAGRTDAGVHAIEQAAHFSYEEAINTQKVLSSLNGTLPIDIRCKSLQEVPSDFHARYSTISKEYHYHLNLSSYQDPFERAYSWFIPQPLNLPLMEEAAQLLVGTHDFSSFANEAHAGAAARNPIRTIKRISFIKERVGMRIEFEGESFLYKMVRNLTGLLVDVGLGKLSKKDVATILQAKDRKKSSRTAPPQGLFLVKLNY